MGKGRWWYDHTYQAFKARIKGLKSIIDLEDDTVVITHYKELMLKEIDNFIDKTNIELTENELITLVEDIFKDNDEIPR